ncbi:MAG: sulfite exporter TauE/SafE family protein [Gammaproteobacteria bacterium]|nr:sulfite exporter TauE/SafE family protein [Gammaproteobacteria bacterium]
MPAEASFIAAFLVGLLGGVHCVGMCGGIVGALTFGLPADVRASPARVFPYLLAYNLARISAYILAGALMGGLGSLAMDLVAFNAAQQVLQVLAGLFMVMLGLYLAGWWAGLARVEQAGGVIWRRIEPFARRLLPVRSPRQALLLGFLWGWLPCGLVYSTLIWALASGSPAQGALLLLGFGLGTLPNLLLMGVFAAQLGRFLRKPVVRSLAGGAVVLFGVYTAFLPLSHFSV